ncbi:MAG: hypothetical protein ACYTHM_20855, partial [Planctomycetota bacterium]
MGERKTQICPECRYHFIGPVPHFCPRCHACLHGSTTGTETRSITVTFHDATPPPTEIPHPVETLDPAPSPPPSPNRCSACKAVIIGPPPDTCPACQHPFTPDSEPLPRILEVEAGTPAAAKETTPHGPPASPPAEPPSPLRVK